MIAEALKKALLQAAIQGKLTEQLPEDGNAKDLLKEIQKEKNGLVKEGKIKKDKPLPEIREEEIPFDIPENWVWVRLGAISTKISAGGDKPKQFSTIKTDSLKIPVVSNGEQNEGIFGYTDTPVITETSITISGRGTIGYSCVRNYPYMPIVRLISVTPTSSIDPYYLKHVFSALLESGVGTSIQQLTIPMIVPKIIPLPPLSEQVRIAHKLEILLPEIETLKKEENKLDNLEKAFPGKIRASILQAAIQGKLTEQLSEDGDARDLLKEIQKEKARLIKEGKIKKQKPLPEITEDEIPFDIPENWTWVRLGDYVDFKIGKTPSRGESSFWGNDIPWVSISDMNDQPRIMNTKEKISNKAFNKVFKGNIVPRGTLIMSFKLTIGRMSFLGIDALHNEAIISITPIIKNSTTDNYLFKVLPFFAQTGETKGAIKGETLNSSSIRRLVFPLAPLAEQKRIVEKLDELLPLCTSLETTSS